MLCKSLLRLSLLLAFFALPLAVQADPVTFQGTINASSNTNLNVTIPPNFTRITDTTATTTIILAFISQLDRPFTENGEFHFGLNFTQPSVLNLGEPFHFTSSGNQAGVTFTVTQPGAQFITLGGVEYYLIFQLSLPSIVLSQTQTVSATLRLASSIPEPATMLLLASGLTGIVIKVRKRRKAA